MTGSLDKCADLGWWGPSPWESGGSGWKSGGGAFPLSAPHSWGKMASDCWSDGCRKNSHVIACMLHACPTNATSYMHVL